MTMTSLMKSGPTQLHKCKMKSLWKLMMMLKFLTRMWNRSTRKRKSKTNDPYEIKKDKLCATGGHSLHWRKWLPWRK